MIAHPHRRAAATRRLVTLAAVAALAVAAAAPSQGATAHGSLCSVAKGVAAQLVQAGSLSPNTQMTPTRLKALYLTVQRNEPALLGAASGSMKTDLRRVFGFINVVITDFEHANWQIAGMAPYFPALVARGKAVQTPYQHVKTYFRSTCGFKNV